jgi:hypothetical protein
MKMKFIPGDYDEAPEEEDYQAPPPEPRPFGMSLKAYRELQAQGENLVEKVEARYQRNVARRLAREAQAAAAQPKAPATSEGNQSAGTKRSTSLPKSPKPSGSPRGHFLAGLRKKEGTWRLQLFAMEALNGTKVPKLRFQLWTSGEGGHPISDGPGCGFTMSLEEAEKVIVALQDGLAMVRTNKFDPNSPKNYVPRSK